ncbi:NADH dehydrogenase [ubiquinone] 1 alpha subcomplex subunit 5-like [Physella acuta]|uniref:NADH dehydrogenase [ubiquinone] 1 alpha subcomplex subunit 5-like n=1 Tax=Physella acuta TaxID=109671 RepID=UPI0027DBE067|nr:NADH dehydrogenase [ubiquinone] 1 alpha subcomplex subunit 5-like [Physella acuta]
MAGVHKITTGLTGLAVSKHPHQSLGVLYSQILGVLQKMPSNAGYRKHTEQIINERLSLVKSESDVSKLESKINCGQIEEVIKQAERELSLARKMLLWKPWEPLVGQAPPNQWKWPLP